MPCLYETRLTPICPECELYLRHTGGMELESLDGEGMSTVRSFVIAKGSEEGIELKVVPQLKEKELEGEGFSFGLWLLESASSPFLKGLAEALDEAEIRKKVGLGY